MKILQLIKTWRDRRLRMRIVLKKPINYGDPISAYSQLRLREAEVKYIQTGELPGKEQIKELFRIGNIDGE